MSKPLDMPEPLPFCSTVRCATCLMMMSLAATLLLPGSSVAQSKANEERPLEYLVCDQPKPAATDRVLAKCSGEGARTCGVYSPIRSNLCEARRLGGKSWVNYELFGMNDCRTNANRRALKTVTHVVIHNGGWNAAHNKDTWACREASSHYSIQRDGTIYQHIGEELIAWHAERMNAQSIGIELNLPQEFGQSCNSLRFRQGATAEEKAKMVLAACEPTEEQYNALKGLLADIAQRTAVTVDDDHIVGHCENEAPSGHADPRGFDWTRIGLSNSARQGRLAGTACNWYQLHN